MWCKMDVDHLLQPPTSVRGMFELDRDAFKKRILVPRLRVPKAWAHKVLPLVKKLLLKMEKLRPVIELPENDGEMLREILLHPVPVQSWESLPTDALEALQVHASQFFIEELELGYDNWRPDEIFRSVLSTDSEGVTSFSRIGHIVHLNLRDHLLPYKSLIGQVLLDKVAGCRTVVNKAKTIDNEYRFFQLELLSGVPEYQVETKENGVPFEFDFSCVYWNPRLSTEHERIVQLLRPDDVLYDVFAGVGPFSVPAARKRCHVLANDLNPDSFRWLQHNVKRNKCAAHTRLYNKDGRAFILHEVRSDLMRRWVEQSLDAAPTYTMHITMNLPAMAVEFLDAFRGLALDVDEQHESVAMKLQFASPHFNYPIVHVYTFAKDMSDKKLLRDIVEQQLGVPLGDQQLGIHFVRNVSPRKDMYRLSFRLTKQILTATSIVERPSNAANAAAVADVQPNARIKLKRLAPTDDTDADRKGAKVQCS